MIELTEYSYKGLSGNIYHPRFKDGKWWIFGDWMDPCTLEYMARLCKIPEEEVIILKLRYG